MTQDLDWLLQAEPDTMPDWFRPTSTFKHIVERLHYAAQVQAPLVLVTGAHGAGKTTTLRWISTHGEALMWECRPGYKPQHVLADIAQRLGINVGQGWQMMTSIVVEQLAAQPRTIILDEAQRLDYAGMDLLKYLADQTGSTFVLAASPSLETRINKWPDIASRTSVRVRVGTLSQQEFIDLYKADGFSVESLSEIHKLTGGVMRSVEALIRDIDDHLTSSINRGAADLTRENVQPHHIKHIAEKVL